MTPIVASMLQGRAVPQPYGQGFHANLQPHEIQQIVSAVIPLVVSLIQSRSYQSHFGQFMPRAA